MSRLRNYVLMALIAFCGLVGCIGKPEQPAVKSPSQADEQAFTAQGTVPAWQVHIERLSDSPSILLTERATRDFCDALLDLEAGALLDLMLDGGIENGCLASLSELSGLEQLRIREAAISDGELKNLLAGSAATLRILNLPQAKLTAVGIEDLAELPRLSQLRLGGPQLDDKAAIVLAKLPNLRSLHLIGPNLTGSGLAELAKSPKLVSLYIDDCPLPDAAWETVFAAKPNLHVHVDQQHHDRDPSGHAHE